MSEIQKLAWQLWREVVEKTDWAIDATCGQGQDTLQIASLVEEGGVIALDIQKDALEKTKKRCSLYNHIHYFLQSHASFPPIVQNHPIKLIVYNLGYLPQGDKKITTTFETTWESIERGLELIAIGGLISIMCYSGHPEGAREESQILALSRHIDKSSFVVSHHQWINRKNAPSLLIIKKLK